MRELILAPEIREEFKKDFPSVELENAVKWFRIYEVLAPSINRNFCEDMGCNIEDIPVMLEYNDNSLQMEIDEEDYYAEWAEELAWYHHARQMGWE